MDITLLGGENILGIDLELEQIKRAESSYKVVFADDFSSVQQLPEFSGGLSLFGERTNLLIIRNIFQGSKTFIDSLLGELDNKNYTFALILVENGNLDKRSRLYKYCSVKAKVSDQKEYSDNEKRAWLKKEMQQQGVTCSVNVERKLLELLFSSLQQNPALELQKVIRLLEYDQRNETLLNDLQVLSPEWENTIWQLFNYAVKDKANALQLFGKVWQENPIAPPLLGFIGSQLRQMICYYDFPEELNGYVKGKLNGLVASFSRVKLDLAIRRLVSLEQSIKTSQIDPQLGIIMYIISL